jgi:hypothetical protein
MKSGPMGAIRWNKKLIERADAVIQLTVDGLDFPSA